MAVISNGTTLIDNGTLDAAVPSGKMILLSTQTASASATISFTSGIDSTYDSYVFKFINIHPASETYFQFNMSTDSGSNYNVTKTTTTFYTEHGEGDGGGAVAYQSSRDLAQSTSDQILSVDGVGNDSDQNFSGTLHLFNPSSTTFVKHFIANGNNAQPSDYSQQGLTAGYGNTTSAVNAIRFQMSSGNIDSGVIKLYGDWLHFHFVTV
jgi:hypothetical protein